VTAFSNLEDRCEKELAAADRAESREDRVAHLELALRYALLAVRAHPETASGTIISLQRAH
jgi:hypothetical protein